MTAPKTDYRENLDDDVSLYYDEIDNVDPLSREKELELSERIISGDEDARDELIRANLLFVVYVARSYTNYGLPIGDLISAGNFGLIKAAERFDGTRGYKFITYAVWWIRQSILWEIANQGRTVRLPLNKIALLKKISIINQRYENDTGRLPTTREAADELGIKKEETVKEALLDSRNAVYLDNPIPADREDTRLDFLPDDSAQAQFEQVDNSDFRNELTKAMESVLDEREKRILVLYFGLWLGESFTLKQIGETLGVTRERVRQVKEDALSKLRNNKESRRLLCEIWH